MISGDQKAATNVERNRWSSLLLAALAFLYGHPLSAQQIKPQPKETLPGSFLADPLDLQRLTNNADLIIIGRVNSITNAGRATLGIDKVVKGEADARTVDFEFFPNRPPAYVRIQPELFGMFFLKQNEAGGVGQVLLTSRAAEDRRMAVRVLSSALADRATELLRHTAKDMYAVVKMQSISALLNRDDIETLEIAEQTLLNPPAGTDPYLLDNISAALEGIKDPRAIPALQRLLRSSNSRTRLGAVSALRQMRLMEAVDGLVIALGDNDRDVRYQAVIGLAELTGQNQWAPAIGTFENDEQKYLDHWKEWAKTR